MAYPANIDGDLEGISAIDVGKDAKITYPAALDTEDTVAMYTGDNRLTPEKAKTYEASLICRSGIRSVIIAPGFPRKQTAPTLSIVWNVDGKLLR